jgi:hypothetical protein
MMSSSSSAMSTTSPTLHSSFGVERSAAWPGSLLVGVSGERRDA